MARRFGYICSAVLLFVASSSTRPIHGWTTRATTRRSVASSPRRYIGSVAHNGNSATGIRRPCGGSHPSSALLLELASTRLQQCRSSNSCAQRRPTACYSQTSARSGRESEAADTDTSTKATETDVPARLIYSQPVLYDLAFGYRDYVAEVEFLLEQHEELTQKSASSSSSLNILEVAAGPARHALTALSLLNRRRRGTSTSTDASKVYCVDASSEMAAYAQQLVARTDAIEQQQQQGVGQGDGRLLADDFTYHVTDMRHMDTLLCGNDDTPRGTIDTAWILLGSLQHLLTNADVVACLQSIHALLKDDNEKGTVFIELPHPREAVFGMGDGCTRNSWTVPLTFDAMENDVSDDDEEFDLDEEEDDYDYDDDEAAVVQSLQPKPGELTIVWGDQDDAFDPITQIRQFTIEMAWVKDTTTTSTSAAVTTTDSNTLEADSNHPLDSLSASGRLRQVVPLRVFTVPEMAALAQCAGFKVVALYGALERDEDDHVIDINDEDAAYRFVCALQKM
jgi:SAM-dependent methyltransferase